MAGSPILFPPVGTNFQNITGDHELKKGSRSLRSMRRVTHIVLHQTGCNLGTEPERWYDVACHCGVTSEGRVLYVNGLDHAVWHGHGYNGYSVGIEVDGNFAGIEGDNRTYFASSGSLSVLSDVQTEGVRNAIEWIVGQAVAMGGGFTSLVAHRQASDQRDSDPGSAIWNAVGPWARKKLHLQTPWWESIGSGKGLPRQWDPSSIYGWWGTVDRVGIGMLQIVCNRMFRADLEIDGTVGPKTKQAIKDLNDHLGLGPYAIILADTLENLAITEEWIQLTDWIERTIKKNSIPDKLRGNAFFDVLAAYPLRKG